MILETSRVADRVAENIAALKDEDWGIREDAAAALGRLRDARGVRPLIIALKDSDQAVRMAAKTALIEIGEAAIEDLTCCLRDPSLTVQEAAAAILATIGDSRALEPLISSLLSEDWVVRMYAAKGLTRLQAVEAIPTLIVLLQDKVQAVRDEAILALQAVGEAAAPMLIDSLKDRDWRTRLRAVEALGLLKSSLAVEPLLGLLFDDPDSAVRQDVARALGEIGDARAVEPLLEAIKFPVVRPVAIEALGKIGDGRAVKPLVAVLQGLKAEDFEGRLPGCTDERFEEQLLPVEAAVRALGRIQDASAIPALIGVMKSTMVRAEAADALAGFGRAIIPQLLDFLKTEQDDNIRFHLKETLQRVGWKPGQVRL